MNSLSVLKKCHQREEEKFTAIQLTLFNLNAKFSSANAVFILLIKEFTNNDFLRLWKGLYYCMWMSDKPLVQEELTEDLGSLIHCFPDVKVGVQFFRNFLETMCLEWFGIDQWRIDKFMMVSNLKCDLDDSRRLHLEISGRFFSYFSF